MVSMKIYFKQALVFLLATMFCLAFIKLTNILSGNKEREKWLQKSSPTSSKRVGYKQRKAMIHKRVDQFILRENFTFIDVKTARKSKKNRAKVTYTSYRLNRMLYQLWDPDSEINEENLISCDHLASADENVYKKGKRFARKLNRKFYEYTNITDIWELIRYNCNSVRKLFRFQNPKFGPASYSIGYTITLDRTAEQSIRMLLSIYHHDNIYCVHPNARYGFRYYNVFRRLSECIPNIILPDRIFEIRFKTHNRLKAELACFKKLLNSTVPWKYGINLPSSAFPLRNNSYLVKHLRAKPYEVSISWQTVSNHFLSRVKYSHTIKELESGEKALVRTSKKKMQPPGNIQFYRKGVHFISTREFYQFLIDSSLAKEFLDWAKDTKNPEDFYYSSLYKHYGVPGGKPDDLLLSPPQQQLRTVDADVEDVAVVPPNELIISLWSSDRGHRCHGKYRGSVCIFGAADLRWLLQQEYLFANSFDFRIDRVVIDCLSKNLKQPILKPHQELLSQPLS